MLVASSAIASGRAFKFPQAQGEMRAGGCGQGAHELRRSQAGHVQKAGIRAHCP